MSSRLQVDPGDVSSSVKWLIGGACAITALLALYGMEAMWEYVEWALERYRPDEGWAYARDPFWYTNGLVLAVLVAIGLAWSPPFRVARLLRVAVLLPIIQLGAIIVAAKLWTVFEGDVLAKLTRWPTLSEFSNWATIVLPSASDLGLGFAAMVAMGILIKRRHGEWAHATVTLALAYLVLLGLWLPVLSRLAVKIGDWYVVTRVLEPDQIRGSAVLPPALVAIAFTAIAFHAPRFLQRHRGLVRTSAWVLFGIAMVTAMSLPDQAWLVYLESSYLVMSAVVLAIGAIALLVAVTWLRSLLAHLRLRRLPRHTGTVEDDGLEAARYEITSWLRGPRLSVRPFVVATQHGSVPVHGATMLAPVSAATTPLATGEHVAVLAPGDRVTLVGRTTAADGHPFRATDATEIAYVLADGARPYRFRDVVLVVWRPAVAYLAILIAVALPYLSIFLT